MDLAIAIATLLHTATPGIAQLVLMIKNTNGTVSIVPMLDAADSKFEANMQQANEWLASHSQPKA